MQTIRIQRFHAQYRLSAQGGGLQPGQAQTQRWRLDRVLSTMVAEALDRAAGRVDIVSREELCIRHLSVPVRVRLSGTDSSVAQAWGKALAETICDAVSNRGDARRSDGVSLHAVRYPSRVLAMVDLAASISREDLSRAWAWRQLGLWQTSLRASPREAVRELVRALEREPAMIVPILCALAGRELLAALARRLEADDWMALAVGALGAAGATTDWRDLKALTPSPRPPLVPARAMGRLSERLVRGSRLAAAFAHTSIPPAAHGALAVLVVLEVNPLLATKRREELQTILEATQAALARAPINQVQRVADAKLEPAPLPGSTCLAAQESTVTAAELAEQSPQEPDFADLRRRAFTPQGGLLFLLTVLDDLSIPARIPEMFPSRPFRWVLHRLALRLAPVTPEDAAALVFAGLAPESTPPDRDDEPPSPVESDLLSEVATEVVEELDRRLQRLEMGPDALLEFVCARRAEIVADPGWIEVHFSLDDVSSDIRRAALDLDPGYLPWLGIVVKFIYE